MIRRQMSEWRLLSDRGQTIILVAFLMVFFVGILGLVVDIGGAYANQRFERSIADSSSLSGAQELQSANRRTPPTAADYEKARELSMRSLVNQLRDPLDGLPACGGVGPPYPADIVNCAIPGTPYYVSVSAPALTCVQLGGCDPQRSVQVTVRRPDFGLVFARIFNQFEWNVVATSVAELGYSANYTLVTLRPPKPSRANDPRCAPDCDDNEDNIVLDGNTTRLFVDGDVGTNTNIKLTAGAQMVLDGFSSVYHFDAYLNWTPPPAAKQLSAPIDITYPIPSRTGGTIFPDDDDGLITDAALCDAERDKVPSSYGISGFSAAAGEIICYQPGIYQDALDPSPAPDVILLTPGLYFFDEGAKAGPTTRFIGGYEADSPGVALVFPIGLPSCNCSFDVASSPLVALNAGSAHPTIASGSPATAALDYSSPTPQPVETDGDPPVLMTLIVQRDPRCAVGLTEPADCPKTNQLKLPGGGSIYLTGVQYAASDQSTIVGGSAGNGYIGQFISWTVQYTGGSQVNFTHAGAEGPGVLRIATPCSPGTACAADYANDPLP
jgi:hypothetical protein